MNTDLTFITNEPAVRPLQSRLLLRSGHEGRAGGRFLDPPAGGLGITELLVLEEICKPLGITGARFDRTLFQNYDEILEI